MRYWQSKWCMFPHTLFELCVLRSCLDHHSSGSVQHWLSPCMWSFCGTGWRYFTHRTLKQMLRHLWTVKDRLDPYPQSIFRRRGAAVYQPPKSESIHWVGVEFCLFKQQFIVSLWSDKHWHKCRVCPRNSLFFKKSYRSQLHEWSLPRVKSSLNFGQTW